MVLKEPVKHRLRADCERCVGLCCVAPAFSASADFAIDKRAGHACPNLQPDFRCSVHTDLRRKGFPGCAAYDCFGAGQHVTQVTFGGQDWRRTPSIAPRMFEVFTLMRQLHELLWYLNEALTMQPARPLHPELWLALDETERLTREPADVLVQTDVRTHGRHAHASLVRASELVRAAVRLPAIDRRGADLIGADLRGADLRGADMSRAYLMAADLRDADLRTADVMGADFRGADLRGADLTGILFLTRPQVDAASGDITTRLPPSLARPTHWPGRPRSS